MKGIAAKIGGGMIALALLVSFFIDFSNLAQGGAIDLRNRITGLRLIEHGIDPYHYKWREGEPEEFCDVYNHPNLTVSKTTASPTLLLLHAPLALLPYRLAQILWLLVQWAMLLATAGLWLRACMTASSRWAMAVGMTAFTYTAAWRLHAERGQSYIVLAFVFACWLLLTMNTERRREFLAGCVAGLLIALRPSFLLVGPFLVLHRRGQLAGAAVGLLLAVGLPLLINPASWSHYFAAMQDNSEYYRSGIDMPYPQQHFPAKIEGIPTDILGYFVPISYADFSFFAFLHAMGCDNFPAAPVLLVVLAPFAVWLWLTRRASPGHVLTGIAAWYFLVDLALPAYRNNYNDVLMIDVVAVGLITSARIPWVVWPCALALPVGWAVYAFSPEDKWLINASTALFTLSAVLVAVRSTTFLFNNRATSRKVDAAC